MEQRFFCLRGFMKSGTNWLGGLLNTHHDISVVGEFHFEHVVTELNRTFKNTNTFLEVPGIREATRGRFDEMVKSAIAQATDPKAKLLGERTPYSIEPITLRGVPHISIVRDGRDVLVSRAFHLFNNPQAHRLFTRIPEMARAWEHFKADPWFFQKNPDQLLCYEVMVRESGIAWNEQVMADQTIHERHPNLPVAFVRYEDLHADVNKERRRLFEFLEVDPDACDEIEGDLNPGFRQERPDEFNRKGAIGDWKLYFTDDTTKWYADVAGVALEHLGYDS